MANHQFQPTRFYNTMGSHDPALRIAAGDTVVTSTLDAMGCDSGRVNRAQRPNPQTGPFYVEGAEPGDTLVVHLDRLTPNRAYGYARKMVAPNAVDPGHVPAMPWPAAGELYSEWRMDAEAGTVVLIAPKTKLGSFTLPLAPMLGCIGVAPAIGEAISTATSAAHGGNMDYRWLVSGATVYLPVFAPGALLFLGDGHAVQGDGEIVGSGVEISLDVQFTVDVLKGHTIGWPRGENADYIFTLGNARPLDQATQHATTEMLVWLLTDYGLDPVGAHILMGQCVEYDLGNMYDPAYTMVCKMPKRFLA